MKTYSLILLTFLFAFSSQAQIGEVGSSAPLKTTVSGKQYTWVNHLKVRSEPSYDGKTLEKLLEGEFLQALGETGGKNITVELRGTEYTGPWVKVKTQSGKVGWVFSKALTESRPYTNVYSWVDDLRVRASGDFDAKTITKMGEGEQANFTGRRSAEKAKARLRGKDRYGYWMEITTDDGKTGWVHGAAIQYEPVKANIQSEGCSG